MIIWKFSAFLPLFRPLIPVSCRLLKIAAKRLLRQENFTFRFVSESTKKRISLHLSSLPPGLPPPRLSALISCPSVSCVPISSLPISRIPTFSLLPPASWPPASQLSISCSPLLDFRPPCLPASHLSARPVSYHSVSRVRPPPDFRSPGNFPKSRRPFMASDNAQKPPHTAAAHTPLHLRIYCTEHPSRIFPDRMAAGRPGKPEVPTNTYVRKKQPLPLSSRPERPCPLFFRLLSPEELRNTAAAARTMSPITLKSRRVLSHPAAFTLSLFGNPAPSLRLLRKRSLPPRPPLPSPRPPAEHGSTG